MVTTITGGATTGAAASLALIAIVTLLALLFQKEIAGGLEGARARDISRALNIAIAPLIIVSIAVIVLRAIDSLR